GQGTPQGRQAATAQHFERRRVAEGSRQFVAEGQNCVRPLRSGRPLSYSRRYFAQGGLRRAALEGWVQQLNQGRVSEGGEITSRRKPSFEIARAWYVGDSASSPGSTRPWHHPAMARPLGKSALWAHHHEQCD